MRLDVNGQRMQTGNTCTVIFSVKGIVAHLQPRHDVAAGRHHRRQEPAWA